MKRRHGRNNSQAKQLETTQAISRLAAKILAEEGINDYLLAKQRAAQRLHLPGNTGLPKNSNVQRDLADYLEIFDSHGLIERQRQFKKLAQQIMALLEDFQPLATGPVVDGVITKTSSLHIHVFAPTPEHVATMLLDKNIPYQLTEQRISFKPNEAEFKPAYKFLMGDIPVYLCVFSEKERRKTPIDPISSKPTIRLGLNVLKQSL